MTHTTHALFAGSRLDLEHGVTDGRKLHDFRRTNCVGSERKPRDWIKVKNILCYVAFVSRNLKYSYVIKIEDEPSDCSSRQTVEIQEDSLEKQRLEEKRIELEMSRISERKEEEEYSRFVEDNFHPEVLEIL